MDAIVITFDLVDMSAQQYAQACAELAPAFAAVPGLLTKIWLTGAPDSRCGGFYLFADAASADGFVASALARSVAQHPHFGRLDLQRFTVDQQSTAVTTPSGTLDEMLSGSLAGAPH